MGPLV
ncbi:hypothetical protein ECEC4203_3190, partial [Escherichia coli EC4203]